MNRLTYLCILVASGCFAIPLQGRVRLPEVFRDHMVLQQGQNTSIWGWAEPGETVSVSIDRGEPLRAVSDAGGAWYIKFPDLKSGGPHQIEISSGSETVSIKDVLIGEVWVCSGQSNMGWPVKYCKSSASTIAAAGCNWLRQYSIQPKVAATPQQDVSGKWLVCSPQTCGDFTAAGYFMARRLHEKLGVPIGLIHCSQANSKIVAWTPKERVVTARYQPDSDLYQQRVKRLLPMNNPAVLFNSCVAPLSKFCIGGVVWYQGEADHRDGSLYRDKLVALIEGWRANWKREALPFYYVQISPFDYPGEDPSVLPRFWEAQAAVLAVPNTGMVVTSDIADTSDIHPQNKRQVGKRLADLALENTYQVPGVVANGPIFHSMRIEGGTIRVRFEPAKATLRSRDGKALTSFQMIGEQAVWVDVDAKIEGDAVVLSNRKYSVFQRRGIEIKKPVAMRFGWHKTAQPNLENSEGLPASAFRAGTLPDYDYLQLKVAEAAGYSLVYDLDLKNLDADIRYSKDLSARFPKGCFDRIAYFMELYPNNGDVQYIYVSLDAFTKDVGEIGIPSGSGFQQNVAGLKIVSNLPGVIQGINFKGNIEFWPGAYIPRNSKAVARASDGFFDTGDQRAGAASGAAVGSVQIHYTEGKQTLFAINQWKNGADADLGIGNSTGRKTRDWTGTKSAQTFRKGRLRVLVRLKPGHKKSE